jgi:hypothetical protein
MGASATLTLCASQSWDHPCSEAPPTSPTVTETRGWHMLGGRTEHLSSEWNNWRLLWDLVCGERGAQNPRGWLSGIAVPLVDSSVLEVAHTVIQCLGAVVGGGLSVLPQLRPGYPPHLERFVVGRSRPAVSAPARHTGRPTRGRGRARRASSAVVRAQGAAIRVIEGARGPADGALGLHRARRRGLRPQNRQIRRGTLHQRFAPGPVPIHPSHW